MTCILALDLATCTGFAIAKPPYRPAPSAVERAAGAPPPARYSGSISFHRYKDKDNVGRLLDRFEIWLNDMLTVHQPELVVMEAPFAGGIRNANTALILFGLCSITEMVTHRRGVRLLKSDNATIKKYATGNGKAKKPEMIKAARAAGWDPADDNEADALWLVDYAAALKQPKGEAA